MGDTPYSRRFNKRIRRLQFGWNVLLIAIFTIDFFSDNFITKKTGYVLFLFLFLFLPIILMSLYVRRTNRLQVRELERSGWKLCTHCTQDLNGLGDAGVCPECGEHFEVGRDAEAWKKDTSELPPARENLGRGYGEAWDAVRRMGRKLTKHSEDEK